MHEPRESEADGEQAEEREDDNDRLHRGGQSLA